MHNYEIQNSCKLNTILSAIELKYSLQGSTNQLKPTDLEDMLVLQCMIVPGKYHNDPPPKASIFSLLFWYSLYTTMYRLTYRQTYENTRNTDVSLKSINIVAEQRGTLGQGCLTTLDNQDYVSRLTYRLHRNRTQHS